MTHQFRAICANRRARHCRRHADRGRSLCAGGAMPHSPPTGRGPVASAATRIIAQRRSGADRGPDHGRLDVVRSAWARPDALVATRRWEGCGIKVTVRQTRTTQRFKCAQKPFGLWRGKSARRRAPRAIGDRRRRGRGRDVLDTLARMRRGFRGGSSASAGMRKRRAVRCSEKLVERLPGEHHTICHRSRGTFPTSYDTTVEANLADRRRVRQNLVRHRVRWRCDRIGAGDGQGRVIGATVLAILAGPAC